MRNIVKIYFGFYVLLFYDEGVDTGFSCISSFEASQRDVFDRLSKLFFELTWS